VTTRLLYIGGLGRSGTTLLEQLLAQSAGVSAVGEFYSLWERRADPGALCGCGRRLDDCPLWCAVLDEVGAVPERVVTQQRRVDRLRYLPLLVAPAMWPPFRRRMRAYAALLEEMYAGLARHSGDSVVVDSSKRPANAVLLHRLRGVDLRVVQLVRDSRGVVYSWTTHRDAEPRPDTRAMQRYSPIRMSVRWFTYNVLFAALRLIRVPVLRLHYEDLIADPRAALAEVARFGGISSNLEFVNGTSAQMDRPAHTVMGNPVRFASGRIDLVRDDRWRTALTPRQRLTVDVLSWPLLLRYGYLLGRRRPR